MSAIRAGERTRVGAERELLLRVATLAPYLLVLGHVAASGQQIRPVPFVVILAVAAVLGGGMAREYRRNDRLGRHPDLPIGPWRLASVYVGTALLAPSLVWVAEVEVTSFVLVVALMLVNMGSLLPHPFRLPAGGWVVGVWLATLWWAGVRDPVVLAQHLVGGLLVFAAAVVISTLLAGAIGREESARLQADSSARLLERLLGARSLDVEGVAAAAAEAVRHRGFDLVVVRLIDRHGRLARPLAIAGVPARPVLPEPVDQGLYAAVRVSDRLRIDHPDGAAGRPTRRLLMPLRDDAEVVGFVEAHGSARGELPAIDEVEAIVRRAERGLARARDFARDRHDMQELHWLEQRTNDLVSTVSHELRTPVTVIAGLAETLADRWDHLPLEVRRTLLARIAANARRLDTIVGSLLDSGALEGGEVSIDPQPRELGALVDAVLDRLELLTAGHRVRTIAPEPVWVRVDPDLFEHVVENLLANVAHHTPPGTAVEVAVRRVGAHVELAIVDDGPGIPPEELAHVFERFFRGGAPDRRSSGGLGLGLPLARQIARAHGGTLTAERVGEQGGTCFRLTLAATEAPENVEVG